MKNAELGKEYDMILIIFIKQCCIYTYNYRLRFHSSVQMKSKMCSEL